MMKNKLFHLTASATILSFLILPVISSAQSQDATAQTTTAPAPAATTVSAATAKKMEKAKERAGQEIDRRISSLNNLNARIQDMQKITSDFKKTLNTTIQAQISAFSALKAKIDADTDEATLKSDIQSITQSYRIYALVAQQISISAAADRIVTLTTMMTTLGSKLQARVTAAQNAGAQVGSLTTALTDMSARLQDANAKAQQAVALSIALVPDLDDKTKLASNNAALKTARATIHAARKDLDAARKYAQTIIKGLKSLPITATTTPATP